MIENCTVEDDEKFWRMVGAHGAAGRFKDKEVFRGLVKMVSVRSEREFNGKSTRGMRFDGYLDDFVTTLAAMSKRGLDLFRENFSARTARSLRKIQNTNGMVLVDGLQVANLVHVAEWLNNLGYYGPLAGATDQTVCVKALQHYNSCVVGAEEGDIPFKTSEDLKNLVKDIVKEDRLCDKVCFNVNFGRDGILIDLYSV